MSRPRKKHKPLGMDFGEVLKRVADKKVSPAKPVIRKPDEKTKAQRRGDNFSPR